MRKVIITGASSGIGKAIAKTFSERGWASLLIARNEKRLKQLASKLKNCEILVCDLSDPQAIENNRDQILWTPVDALINNAGIFRPQMVDQDTDTTWEQHFQSNLMSAVRMNRVCWDSLQKQKGCVLNISSTLGIRPVANTSSYSALKAAMNNWTLGLAIEGAPLGLRANAICPGIVDTPIHSYIGSEDAEDKKTYAAMQKAQPLGRTGKPQDIAATAYHLCQPEAEWMTGSIINIDGGILLNS